MPTITITQDQSNFAFQVESGEMLMHVLQRNNILVAAPCGGKGACEKCEVEVQGSGIVKSCSFLVEQDISVILNSPKESLILKEECEGGVSVVGKGLSKNDFGVAVDLGTTTIAGSLRNIVTGEELALHGVNNPQIAFGADVISRIEHSLTDEGLEALHVCVCIAISNLIQQLAEKADISSKHIQEVYVAGNTTMLHLLLREDLSKMGHTPFTPSFLDLQKRESKAFHLGINPEATLSTLASFSAFVGSDIAAGLASLKLTNDDENVLFVDIGTNGEIALLTSGETICTATAAGPALEGASIRCGMSAVEGAISSVDQELEFKTIGNKPPQGICGSGLVDLVAHLLDRGDISTEGFMEDDFIISNEKEECTICLTPADVREIQLAKSAIYSGIILLLNKAELSFDSIDKVYLAGGFGNFINIESAVRIGLLPIELKDKIIRVGNASLAGAVRALCNDGFIDHMDQIITNSTSLDLSNEPNFELEYAMNMFFK